MNQCTPAGGHASAGFFLPAPRGYDNAMPAELTEIEVIDVDDTSSAPHAAQQATAHAARQERPVSPRATHPALRPGLFPETNVHTTPRQVNAFTYAVLN